MTQPATYCDALDARANMGRLCVAFLALFLVPLYAASIDTKLVNKDITRTIDLTTHTARHNIKVTVGADLGKSNGDYHIAFSKAMAARIAHIDASFEEDGDADLDIAVDTDPKKDGVVFYRVNLGNLAEGSRKTIVVNAVLTHVMTPLPKATSQTESQKMVYEDDHYVLSPYRTETQKTELKLSSAVIESNSEEPPTQVKREIIAYGPYTNIAAYSTSAMRVHFENNSPFFSMSYCRKEIELSMWGNVAVEEHYELLHRGSNLKGFFSRVDYQRQQGNAPGAIKSIKGELPNGAVDIYYRDAIGNISSSTLRDGEDGPELELVPRFPIFGGWRTEFYMGYNLPLPSYLFRDDSTGRYTLNVTFGSPFEDVVVDDHEVKVILPEGTSNFKVHTSFPLDKQDQEARFTYLDTRGRPVLVLSKSNVIAEHDIHFQVSFDFDSSYIFHEPLLLVGAFFLIFCLTMASSFIAPADFRSDAIATLHAYHDKWTMIRTEFDSVWDKYAKGEIDGAAYKVARSANREAIKGVSEKFQSFVSSLSGDSLAPDARSILMSESELDRVRADMYDAANPDAALPDKALKAVRDKTAHVRQAVHKHQ